MIRAAYPASHAVLAVAADAARREEERARELRDRRASVRRLPDFRDLPALSLEERYSRRRAGAWA